MQLLHQNATPAARDFVRTYVWMLWLGSLLLFQLPDLGTLPFDSHLSVGLFARLPGSVQQYLLAPESLAILQVCTVCLICCTIIKPRQVVSSVLACLLLTVIQCQLRGFGHVNHAEIVLLLAAYTLTYFDFIDLRTIDQRVQPQNNIADTQLPFRPGAPIIAIVAALCITYSLTGLCRLSDGGLELYRSGSLTAWCEFATLSPHYFDVSFGAWLMDIPGFQWVLEAGYPLITIVEILAPLCLVSKWFRRVFLMTMVPFHLMTVLLMGILFWENLALYVLLFDISRWLPNAGQVTGRIPSKTVLVAEN